MFRQMFLFLATIIINLGRAQLAGGWGDWRTDVDNNVLEVAQAVMPTVEFLKQKTMKYSFQVKQYKQQVVNGMNYELYIDSCDAEFTIKVFKPRSNEKNPEPQVKSISDDKTKNCKKQTLFGGWGDWVSEVDEDTRKAADSIREKVESALGRKTKRYNVDSYRTQMAGVTTKYHFTIDVCDKKLFVAAVDERDEDDLTFRGILHELDSECKPTDDTTKPSSELERGDDDKQKDSSAQSILIDIVTFLTFFTAALTL